MNNKEVVQQQKITSIFIFSISILALSNGLSKLDQGVDGLKIFIVVAGVLGTIFAIYSFFKAK